ncbi:DUF6313 family protein [Streptomyces bathyalis]|uniref:DUF6313 family protein n=1 Tax=Streptomyces bathyalis TaxID=2710756 RepID=UPI003CCD7C30
MRIVGRRRRTTPSSSRRPRLSSSRRPRVRPLSDLYHEGGVEKAFAEDFVQIPHKGCWATASDHWERTVEEILNSVRDFEGMPRELAVRKAEASAQDVLRYLAQRGLCSFCTT